MDAVQLNVRLPRSLKERGDETLAAVGSSPARIIRMLYEKLAQGGDAYGQVSRALSEVATYEQVGEDASSAIAKSSHLFEMLGNSIGLDISSFEPSSGNPYELIEEEDWRSLADRELA